MNPQYYKIKLLFNLHLKSSMKTTSKETAYSVGTFYPNSYWERTSTITNGMVDLSMHLVNKFYILLLPTACFITSPRYNSLTYKSLIK